MLISAPPDVIRIISSPCLVHVLVQASLGHSQHNLHGQTLMSNNPAYSGSLPRRGCGQEHTALPLVHITT